MEKVELHPGEKMAMQWNKQYETWHVTITLDHPVVAKYYRERCERRLSALATAHMRGAPGYQKSKAAWQPPDITAYDGDGDSLTTALHFYGVPA